MRLFRLSKQIVALFAVLLLAACNLSPQEETLPTATPTTQADTKPTVTILTPETGSEHRVNTELRVSANVRDSVGVTRITMSANGQPVKTVSTRVGDTITDKIEVLDYIPLVSGEVTLQVIAYRNQVASDPAQVTVRIVSAQPTATTGVIVTQGPSIDPNDPTCRALINNPLNFRTGPGTNYPSIVTLATGQVVPVVGRLGDNSWYQLSRGQIGWVSGQYVSLYGSFCVNVPIVAPPAVPTVFVTNTSVPPTPVPPTLTPVPTSTPGTPDLVITVFSGPGSSASDKLIIPGGQTQVTAEYQIVVSNIGSRVSGSFTVSLQRRPNGEIVKLAVGELRPNESANLLLEYTFDTIGTFIIEAIVDADSQVSEISEANNTATLVITVE